MRRDPGWFAIPRVIGRPAPSLIPYYSCCSWRVVCPRARRQTLKTEALMMQRRSKYENFDTHCCNHFCGVMRPGGVRGRNPPSRQEGSAGEICARQGHESNRGPGEVGNADAGKNDED